MNKKRRAVIKTARNHGWKGDSLESLKAWAFEEGISEFGTAEGTISMNDIDEIFASAKRLKIEIDEDDEDGDPTVTDKRSSKEGDEDEDLDEMGEKRRKSRRERQDEQDGDTDWVAKLNGVDTSRKHQKMDRSAAERAMHKMQSKRYNRQAAQGKTIFGDAEMAEFWVAKTRIEMAGSQDYPGKARDREIVKAAHASFDATLGGVLLPTGFSLDIINTTPQYGSVRDLVGVYQMQRAKEWIPRFGTSVNFSKVAENQASSETNATFDGVWLDAEEISGMLVVPLRLMEQSPLNIADILYTDVDNAQRKYEDQAFWLGTNNWEGVATKIGANSQITVSGLSSVNGITPTDMLNFAAQLPDRCDEFEDDIAFFSHASFDRMVFQRFTSTSGGAAEDDITQKARPSFAGTPINRVNVLPSSRSFATGTNYAYVGPIKKATKFGVVQNSQRFAESTQRFIEKRQWCSVISVEIAVNCHEVNNTADSMIWGLKATS